MGPYIDHLFITHTHLL
jgi:hypothetical protein